MPSIALPVLRPDLVIRENGFDDRGLPTWMLFDKIRNQFFLLGFLEYELISRWSCGHSELLLNTITHETTLKITEGDIENFAFFLRSNYLCEESYGFIQEMATLHKPFSEKNMFYWLVKNYLFFRIPLFHPDRLLKRSSAVGRFLFSRVTFFIMLILLAIAYLNIAPRWEEFTHTYSQVFTWQGIIALWLAIGFSKFFHEFGHAYMCKHYNLHVPTMGFVFIIFWPMLYTDTTESWHLDHKKRLWIVSAGMWMETYSAIIAAIVWISVDSVTIKAVAFSMIAVSWLLSVVINVSPFFRFDGYYFLSDILNIPNLQPRAFAMARWALRKLLFGIDTAHENLPQAKRYFFIVYAWITILYRFVVFLGIAFIVYHYFFKALGIVLFIIEIIFFILMPIIHEIKAWWGLRKQMTLNPRSISTLSVLVILLLYLLLPLQNSILIPATLAYKHQALFSPEGSYVQKIYLRKGARVKKNETIIQLASDELVYKQETAKLEMQKINSQLRAAAINDKYLTERSVFNSNLVRSETNYQSYSTQLKRLTIKANFDGVLIELDPYLKKGMYVNKNRWLAEIIDPKVVEVEAFVNEKELDALKLGARGIFYSEEPYTHKLPVTVVAMEHSNMRNLAPQKRDEDEITASEGARVETPTYLVADYGGAIPVGSSDNSVLSPIKSVYRINLRLDTTQLITHVTRGSIIIYTDQSHSQLYYITRYLKQLWNKEAHL